MSTLKVNKLRDTAGSADAITLDPNGGAVLAGVTTMTTARVTSGIVTNTFIVGAGVTISESGIEASGIGITCANINGTQIGGRRNLIINGAMLVSQRGDSTGVTNSGYFGPDRFKFNDDGDQTESISQSSVTDLAGFSKAHKRAITTADGNFPAGEYSWTRYSFEGQDLQGFRKGFSDAKPMTISFFVKSYQAGNYVCKLYDHDNSRQIAFLYTIDASATWQHIVHTFPGDTTGKFDSDANQSLSIDWVLAVGTNFTSGTLQTTWGGDVAANAAAGQNVDFTDSTNNYFELTGVQFEIGSQATPFEHRSYGEELELCKRYYQQINGDSNDYTGFPAYSESTTSVRIPVMLHPAMRAAFTHSKSGTFRFQGATNDSDDSAASFSLEGVNTTFNACTIRNTNYSNMGAADRPGNLQFRQDSSKLKFDAEL